MRKIFIGLLLIVTTIFASQSPRAVIIFDASGSMWGKVDGKTKIEIARDALKNVVNEWNPNVELGLITYGHRRKGDCNDIETIIPVGDVDKDTMISTVLSIMPKGKTPISRSIKKAAQELRYTEEKATVILISDGKETCDPDPCATAKELENEGIDFVTHVIGFNVDQKTDEQLECIASVTGGEYFSAKNATALNDAMRSIFKKVEIAEPIKKVEPKPVVKKLKNNLVITAIEKDGGKWVQAYHDIYPIIDGEKQDYLKNCWSKKKEECVQKIPLGKYILSSKYNEFKKDTEFEVKSGEVTKLNIIMGQTGEVVITAIEKEGGRWVQAYHDIYPIIDGEKQDYLKNCWSKKKEECKQQIPLGKYILSSKYNEFKKDTEFEVKAGEVTKLNIIMGQTAELVITATEKEGGRWVRASHYIYPILDKEKQNYLKLCWSEKKKECKQQIPLGKYILSSKYNEFKKDTEFEVKTGEVTKLNIIMGQTGELVITATEKEGGRWVRASHHIYPILDKEKQNYLKLCWSEKKKECKQQIPLGKYILSSKYNEFKKDTEFEVTSSETTKLNIIFEPFRVEVKCKTPDTQVSYEVYSLTGKMVADKRQPCSKTLDLVLESGRYSVEAKTDNNKKDVEFTIGSGDSKLIIDLTK